MKKLVLGIILGIFIIGFSLFNVFGVLAEENETNQTDDNITLSCGSDNLNLCLNEASCKGAGGEWEDSVCSKEEQNNEDDNETDIDDNETEIEDDNETKVDDEKPACSTINNISQCRARKNCRYNSTSGKCVKITKIHKLKETLQAYLNSTECPEDCTCAGSTIKCETENGRVMTVVAGKSGNVIIITKTANASTTVVLIKNATGLFGNFSGKVKKIKYLPDEIKEIVLKKLKMKNCSNCTIELKQDGTYLMNIEGKYRILGIFPKRVVSVTQIDSGTGEIILIKRSWWRFLAVKGKE